MKYIGNEKYTKIKMFSETITKIHLTDRQEALLNQLQLELAIINDKLKSAYESDSKVFLMPLLLLEGESTSLIEGTRSMYEDFSYDFEEINNIPQWETRNLISLYDKYLFNDYYFNNFVFSNGSISNMHLDMFNNSNSKFKMTFDTQARINQVRPGAILNDDSKPNFIGNSKKIEEANIILLKPSLKAEFLHDLTSTLAKKIESQSLLFKHLIISHPIFEAIHPFADGNGRIGRLVLSLLYKKMIPSFEVPFYISEAFNRRKDEYKENLLELQLNNDFVSWNKWIAFFIDCFIQTKKNLESRVTKMIDLWNSLKGKSDSTEIRKEIKSLFFKFYLINKPMTIKHLVSKYPQVSLQTIYKDFDLVVKELKVEKRSKDYYAFQAIFKIIKAWIH